MLWRGVWGGEAKGAFSLITEGLGWDWGFTFFTFFFLSFNVMIVDCCVIG